VVVIDIREAMKRVAKAQPKMDDKNGPATIYETLALIELVLKTSGMALASFQMGGIRDLKIGLESVRELLQGAKDLVTKERRNWR